MSMWSLIIAGPNLEGLGADPWFLIAQGTCLLFIAAVLYVMSYDSFPALRQLLLTRTLHRAAVGLIFVTGFILAISWAASPFR